MKFQGGKSKHKKTTQSGRDGLKQSSQMKRPRSLFIVSAKVKTNRSYAVSTTETIWQRQQIRTKGLQSGEFFWRVFHSKLAYFAVRFINGYDADQPNQASISYPQVFFWRVLPGKTKLIRSSSVESVEFTHLRLPVNRS